MAACALQIVKLRESHAAVAPHLGRNALDAVTVAQVAIGLLRQHFAPGQLVHGIVTAGGDVASNGVAATIDVGRNPLGIAIAPDGAKAYVTDFSDDTVDVIDTASRTVTATVPVGNGPLGIAITPDGGFAYVANRQPFGNSGAGDVSVIDTADDTVVATVKVGNNPTSVAIGAASAPCPSI